MVMPKSKLSLNKCFIAYEKDIKNCLKADALRFWIMKIVMKWDDNYQLDHFVHFLRQELLLPLFNLFGKMPNDMH